MEVNEIGARLVRRYWFVLLIAIGIPILLVGGLVVRQPATYTAHARIMAAAVPPQAQAQADAIVSQVQAIATSRDVVAAALSGAKLNRDPAEVVKAVQIAGVGSSGTVDISYTDTSPSMAQQVTGALATAIVHQLAGVHSGLPVVVDELDALLAELADKRAALQAISKPNPADTQALANLDRVITDLTNDRQKLDQLAAVAVAPAIVDSAARPPADSKGLATKLAVAGLLGLVLGLLFAGVNETVRPGLSGAGRVARQLRVPVLGRLGSDPAALADIGRRLRLAGRRQGVTVVVLMRADGLTVTPELVERLEAATLFPEPVEARVPLTILPAPTSPAGPGLGTTATQTVPRSPAVSMNGANPNHDGVPRRIFAVEELDPNVEGDDIGLVVLVGRHTRLGAIENVADLVTASGWPLLGVLDDPRNRSGV